MNRRTLARWSGYVAFAIAFAVACAFLAHWQFARNDERSAELVLIEANYDATPVPLDELIPSGAEFDPEDEWRPVEITGEYLSEDQMLVRNRPHGGTAAFEVLVPLRSEDGRIFIVNRGWVPPGQDQPDPDVIPAAPDGTVSVVARLQPGEELPRSGRSAPEGQVPTIHLPTVADGISTTGDTVTSAYGLLVSEQPAPATRPAAPGDPSEDPGPHLSYAIQWILFAIMGFGFIWYMIRTERRHRAEDAEDAEGGEHGGSPDVPARRKPTASPRRRDRDMQEEDALLER